MPSVSLRVVLIGSLYDSNVGAVSRAMSNMNSRDLILIRPKCQITYSAQQAAASGQQALQNRRIYNDWDDFYKSEPEGLRIALTARGGRLREVRDLAETLEWCAQELPQLGADSGDHSFPIYLVLGPEDAGLAFEDLQQCHHACFIPTFGENTSLNLAQAALLALFVFRHSKIGKLPATLTQETAKEGEPADPTGVQRMDQTLAKWLQTLGFDLRENQMSAYTVLRRLILHSVPTKKELRTLEVVLHQSIRKLGEYQAMLKSRNAGESPETLPASSDDPRAPTAH